MATLRHHPLFAPLTFEPLETDYEEFGADTPQREAKRRRIVSNANQYLQGSALFIQTAALRGPFENGWQNPWAKKKPAHSTASRHRQTTRDASLPPQSAEYESNHAPRFKRAATTANPGQREREARAEAERFEREKRKAKAERREQRRQELKKREEKAAELRKDGRGNNAAQPVDLTGASFNTRLTAEALGESRPVAVNSAEEEITRSREYGSREIRSSFTDEWLTRLPSPAKTPELSTMHASELDKQADVVEALTPTRRPSERPHVRSNAAIEPSRPNAKFLSENQRPPAPESRRPSRKDRRKVVYTSIYGDDPFTEEEGAVRKPSAAPSASFSRPQDMLSLKPRVDGAQEKNRPARKGLNFPRLALAKSGMPSASKINLNEDSPVKKPSSSNQERAGQENDFRNDENKISGQLPLKEVLVRSTEQGVTSAVARSRKRRRDHPLHASPTATNSPGFVYRKVSDPTVNAPKLHPTNQVDKETGTRKKKRARLMTFGSLPSQPVEVAKLETETSASPREDHPIVANETGEERAEIVAGSQSAKTDERSQARDLSTQAAILFAQREFQHEFRSPLRNVTAASSEKVVSSQQTRTSTPPPSQPPAEYTAITPFKTFNKGKPFLTDNLPQPGPAQMSTQELFNAATPFAFSTVKKNKSTQKRVSIAASPLKPTGDHDTEMDAKRDGTAAQEGDEGETTVAEVTFADISTTPPTPKFQAFAQRAPSSGPKPPSLNPTPSTALKIRNPSFTAAPPRTSSQVSSSFSSIRAQPPPPPPSSSAPPAASRPVRRQEYRRALSRGRRSQSSQQQMAQRQSGLLDDVDLDSAMDAADSFLDTANLGIEIKGSAGRSGARRA
ncbi:hypothetical protein SLS58_009277 [Diplodia intermedia]|uniref:Uncharacterized protein n=1 Tax=Diplodia intermedia TaxID=856260 RepID=A0ABR3TEA2_9PEZI